MAFAEEHIALRFGDKVRSRTRETASEINDGHHLGGRNAAVVSVDIALLQPGYTLRMGELNLAHMRALAELAGTWPPLLVTPARRIVDGHYRYFAARSLGWDRLDCVIFDGDEIEAFFEAVRLNIRCGLPLTLKERKAAARRIMELRWDWSDRKIAKLCGLSHETVGRLRPGPGQAADSCHIRGWRVAPPSRSAAAAATRARVANLIVTHQEASLRELARLAGTSHETVRSVRRQLAEQRSPLVLRGPPESFAEVQKPLKSLTRDRAFSSTAVGEHFAEWFDRTAITVDWMNLVNVVPLSRIYEVADEARRRALAWTDFASALTSRIPGNK